MSVADTIRAKLTAAFAPQSLHVYDDSEKHQQQGGRRAENGGHVGLAWVFGPRDEGVTLEEKPICYPPARWNLSDNFGGFYGFGYRRTLLTAGYQGVTMLR